MKTHKKVSVIPIYLVGLSWLVYALLFPLHAPTHYILCAGVSALIFIIGKAVFPDKVYQTREDQQETAREKEQKAQQAKDPQVAALEKERDRAVSEMRRLNDAIQDEKISAQIDRLEAVSTKIFDYVKDHPEKLPQIRKFMSYYLPTTLKLLRSYDELSRQGVSGQNITGTMEKVEGMMDTIVLAFEKQLDGLFGDQAMDISTDITVLDNMMAREGLTGGDALHKAAQENPVSDPEPELDIRSDSGEADGGITLQL